MLAMRGNPHAIGGYQGRISGGSPIRGVGPGAHDAGHAGRAAGQPRRRTGMTDVALSLLDGIAALPLWALAIVVAVAVTAESSLFVGLVVPGDIIVLLAASGGASPQRIVLLILAVAAGS